MTCRRLLKYLVIYFVNMKKNVRFLTKLVRQITMKTVVILTQATIFLTNKDDYERE